MRKKEAWMFVGATVMALGKIGEIIAMQENTLNDVEYVYYIEVKIVGQKHAGNYHPNDVQQLPEA
jgi:hypothetical protein